MHDFFKRIPEMVKTLNELVREYPEHADYIDELTEMVTELTDNDPDKLDLLEQLMMSALHQGIGVGTARVIKKLGLMQDMSKRQVADEYLH